MEMLGEDDHGIDRERTLLAGSTECGPKRAYVLNEKAGPTISQRDGEEVSPARDVIAPITDHAGA